MGRFRPMVIFSKQTIPHNFFRTWGAHAPPQNTCCDPNHISISRLTYMAHRLLLLLTIDP